MGKEITTTITNFNGGMSDNIREQSPNKFAIAYHFDNTKRRTSLIPNRAFQDWTNNSENIARFVYGDDDSSGNQLYGLGVVSGQTKPTIFSAAIGTEQWSSFAVGTVGARFTDVLFEYKDIVYFFQGTVLSKKLLTGAKTLTESYQTLSPTNVAQPVQHPADDRAYFFVDNLVYRLDNVTWDGLQLTLPSNLKIVGGSAYGNLLAIVCSAVSAGQTNSVMFMWDRDSTEATLTDKIDLGEGEVVHVGTGQDGGIWITQQVKGHTSLGRNRNSTQIKYYKGGFLVKEIFSGEPSDYMVEMTLKANAVVDKNKFYFPVQQITQKEVATQNVIYVAERVGNEIRVNADQDLSSAVTTSKAIDGIFALTGYWYVAHSNDTTVNTANTVTYGTSAYETQYFNNNDSSQKKKLLGVTVITAPLPTAGQIVLKYRTDENASFTTVFTEATDNSMFHSAVNIESSGVNLPQFKEIQFRIESTGGAEITGLKFKTEDINNDIY